MSPLTTGQLAGKTAVVSGGGSGIGRAVTKALSSAGARVVAVGRTVEKLERTVAELPPGQAVFAQAHHESDGDCKRAIEIAHASFGNVDIVVNNAGEYTQGSFASTDSGGLRHAMEVNLIGPFALTRAALGDLRASADGVIINVASTLALRPVPGTLPYCVSKSALLMLTQAIAVEEAKNGVRAVAVCPGVVDTPIHSERFDSSAEAASFLDNAARLHPLGRVGSAGEVADLITFLAGASWTTGSIVTIDGGISLV